VERRRRVARSLTSQGRSREQKEKEHISKERTLEERIVTVGIHVILSENICQGTKIKKIG